MCRIFGFRSILESGVHQSLMDSDNAIIQQSDRHPDGWGVAYYNMGSPHLIKNDNQARKCQVFEKVSGVVSSNTVVAHIRKSTVGPVGPLNTHPFQFGPWVYVHNGNIAKFSQLKKELLASIDPGLQPFILGETDSEILFYLLLSIIKKEVGLEPRSLSELPFAAIVQEYVAKVTSIIGPLSLSQGDYDKNYLTFVISHGENLFAFQGGQGLYFSAHKKRCSQRESCPHLSSSCENPAQSGESIQHLLVSSEVIENENIWRPLDFGEFVGVDKKFRLISGAIRL